MPIDPGSIAQVFSDHWPQVVFGYAILRDAAKPVAKYLRDHYRHASPETLKEAAANSSGFAHRFEQQVVALRVAGLVTDEQMRSALESPAFAQALQRAFVDGSETASEFRHEQLARLVAMQLTGDGESFQSVALRMAAERMKYLTDRQLRELGLMFAVVYTECTEDVNDTRTAEEQFRQYARECEEILEPFDGVEPLRLDVQHMEGLSLLSIAPFAVNLFAGYNSSQETQSPMLRPMAIRFNGLLKPIGTLDAPPVVGRLYSLMDGKDKSDVVALRGVKLFPPGYLIGYTVYSNLHHTTMALYEFD